MLGPILREVLQQARLRGEAEEGGFDGAGAGEGVTVSPTGTPRMLWSPEQWWEAFAFVFFWKSPSDRVKCNNDDLLFFVVHPECCVANSPPYFVRRKGQELPPELQKDGPRFGEVDWCETFLLNLVLQSDYLLAVAVCSYQDVTSVEFADTVFNDGAARVTKKVYASPTRSTVNLESTKMEMASPVPSYPDICFAVENFEDAFNSMVVSEAGQHYCVMLFATDGLGLSAQNLASREDEELYEELPGGVDTGLSNELTFGLSNDSAFVFIPNPNTMQAVDDIQRTPRQCLQGDESADAEGSGEVPALKQEGCNNMDGTTVNDGSTAQGEDGLRFGNNADRKDDSDGNDTQGATAQAGNRDPPFPSHSQDDKVQDLVDCEDMNDPPDGSGQAGEPSLEQLNSNKQSSECVDPDYAETSTDETHDATVKSCLQEAMQQGSDPEEQPYAVSHADGAVGKCHSGSEGGQQHPAGPVIGEGTDPGTSDLHKGSVGNDASCSKGGDANAELASDGGNREEAAKALGLRLFGGYVGYEQIKVVLVGPSTVHPQTATVRRIRMKGPGGQGFAEVAVTLGIDDEVQEQDETDAMHPDPAVKLLKDGLKLGPKAFLQRGIGLAANSLKGAINKLRGDEAHNNIASGDVEYRLQCALMTLSLPVRTLALQILEAACSA
ncbi:unnamed protein product [Ostreobium quekettii]|uniref:Uncharacterized protein n=1 Tax=Ostreobium quekettii TaxID=121088 RepID=A0A8S1J3J0_9CHLO|nr:unnamed protein product [Ostreobium quekettii]